LTNIFKISETLKYKQSENFVKNITKFIFILLIIFLIYGNIISVKNKNKLL